MNEQVLFFRETMRCLSNSLHLEESLTAVFHFLQKNFPLAAITFDQYIPDSKSLHVPFIVTDSGYSECKINIPLCEADSTLLQDNLISQKIIYYPANTRDSLCTAHSKKIAKYLPFSARAYLLSALTTNVSLENTLAEKPIIGFILFLGDSEDCFSARHKQLFEMLIPSFALTLLNRMRMKNIIEEKHRIDAEKKQLEKKLLGLTKYSIIGAKSGLKNVFDSIHCLQDTDIPVLILGETGTGKELISNIIQSHSKRSKKPFIKVNCGAIPDSLLDSELFGFEKGAFTGADSSRAGYFEQAHGGTLFLDEVGELPPRAQTRLLRVLQDGSMERIGGTKPIKVDVRIIAATNRDLSEMRQKGQFREDLYHRLYVFPLQLPPLRQRKDDIPLLLKYFTDTIARRMGISPPPIKESTLEALLRYSWPGNVRELENLVERALIISSDRPVDISKYIPAVAAHNETPTADAHTLEKRIEDVVQSMLLTYPFVERQGRASTELPPRTLDAVVSAHILDTLRYCNGKIYGPRGAAEILGINHSTLRTRMKKMGISSAQVQAKKGSL